MIGSVGSEILRAIIKKTATKTEADPFRRDLSDQQYARWFLAEKFVKGALDSKYALNEFVLFRIVHRWPRNAMQWSDFEELACADWEVTDEMVIDLYDFAQRGLNDGYRTAEAFLKSCVCWYLKRDRRMPANLAEYAATVIAGFGNNPKAKGRKTSQSIDRNIVIRNAVEGLVIRGAAQSGGPTSACSIVSDELCRLGHPISDDGVRKIISRTKRTSREQGYWDIITGRNRADFIPVISKIP